MKLKSESSFKLESGIAEKKSKTLIHFHARIFSGEDRRAAALE